jgi:hypothetical protein
VSGKKNGFIDAVVSILKNLEQAVSCLVETGLGDQEVAAVSGHESMQMLKRYTHLRAENLVKRLDQLVGW